MLILKFFSTFWYQIFQDWRSLEIYMKMFKFTTTQENILVKRSNLISSQTKKYCSKKLGSFSTVFVIISVCVCLCVCVVGTERGVSNKGETVLFWCEKNCSLYRSNKEKLFFLPHIFTSTCLAVKEPFAPFLSFPPFAIRIKRQ